MDKAQHVILSSSTCSSSLPHLYQCSWWHETALQQSLCPWALSACQPSTDSHQRRHGRWPPLIGLQPHHSASTPQAGDVSAGRRLTTDLVPLSPAADLAGCSVKTGSLPGGALGRLNYTLLHFLCRLKCTQLELPAEIREEPWNESQAVPLTWLRHCGAPPVSLRLPSCASQKEASVLCTLQRLSAPG